MKSTITTRSFLQIMVLAGALMILSGYHYMEAQWTPPPSPAPTGNVDAPINIGPDAQVKSGNMGANIVSAIDQMWSDEYCDATGGECFVPTDVGGGGGSLPSCSTSDIIYYNGSSWACESDITELFPPCTDGQILLVDGTSWGCANL